MRYRFGRLTDEEVRSKFFIVPDIGAAMAYGAQQLKAWQRERVKVHAAGGEFLVIGWPDGMTVTYHILDAAQPINLDDLVSTYRAAAAGYRAAGMWGAA